MGGMADSLGGFLGINDGPKAPGGKFGNSSLDTLNLGGEYAWDPKAMKALQQYGLGDRDLSSALEAGNKSFTGDNDANNGRRMLGFEQALATGPLTGSKLATEQVQSNPILGGLYGKGGQLSQVQDLLSGLYKQGFNLTPEDKTMYGQMSGDIARQFGQQGNQAANDLASRGLSSSGAAGATFSGLAGNQNEQLAKAQQAIAQQRYQNTMGQIGQYQNFVNSMGANANNAIQGQFGRQLAGVQNQQGNLQAAAGLTNQANQMANQHEMEAFKENQANKPKNVMDFWTAGTGQGLQSGTAKATSTWTGGMGSMGSGMMGGMGG